MRKKKGDYIMKKIIAIIMAISMMFIVLSSNVLAEETNNKYQTGLLPDKWEDLLNNDSELTYKAFASTRMGDINKDGNITAIDASLCLKIIAGIEDCCDTLDRNFFDVNGDGNITSVDARIILQMVAGLTSVDNVEERVLGDSMFDGLVVGPLETSGSTGYIWYCEVDNDGLELAEKTFDNSPHETIGNPVNHYFMFKPILTGIYTIHFYRITPSREIVDEFNVILTVTDASLPE